MILKHYAFFRSELPSLLDDPGSWESLRKDPNEPAYFLPPTRREYMQRIEQSAGVHQPVAGEIGRWVIATGATSIFSVGVGLGVLEYEIKQTTGLRVIVSEVNNAIRDLERVSDFDGYLQYDIVHDPVPEPREALFLLPRIDTELTDNEIKTVIEKFAQAGIRHICLIPTSFLTLRILLIELRRLLLAKLLRKKRTFCGYYRTKRHFRKLLTTNDRYRLQERKPGGKSIFFLTLAESNA